MDPRAAVLRLCHDLGIPHTAVEIRILGDRIEAVVDEGGVLVQRVIPMGE